MALGVRTMKTEHNGAKRGRGAYFGQKAEAKQASKKRRRAQEKRDGC